MSNICSSPGGTDVRTPEGCVAETCKQRTDVAQSPDTLRHGGGSFPGSCPGSRSLPLIRPLLLQQRCCQLRLCIAPLALTPFRSVPDDSCPGKSRDLVFKSQACSMGLRPQSGCCSGHTCCMRSRSWRVLRVALDMFASAASASIGVTACRGPSTAPSRRAKGARLSCRNQSTSIDCVAELSMLWHSYKLRNVLTFF